MKYKLFDSHAHYYDEKFEGFEGGAKRLLESAEFGDKVGCVINIASNPENSKIVMEQAKKYDFMYCAVGIHPTDAQVLGGSVEDNIRAIEDYLRADRSVCEDNTGALVDDRGICEDNAWALVAGRGVCEDNAGTLRADKGACEDNGGESCSDCGIAFDTGKSGFGKIGAIGKIGKNKIVAIGEIGLDYYWEPVDKELQRIYFERQMELALKYDFPVIIHDRDAHGDVFDIIRKYPGVRGVIHSCSMKAEMARQLCNMGWYISFSGTVTFKNAESVRTTCASVPLDRILSETDAPYLAPVPFRGKLNNSMLMENTVKEIARVHGVTYEEMLKITNENAERLFGLR